uniref:LITD1 n=2 Tax=Poeciliopsis prolifica TaxID=188132 RepID=A0A0S7EWS1_9TELE
MPPKNAKPVQQPTKTAPQVNVANVAHAAIVAHASTAAPINLDEAQDAPTNRDILGAISLLKEDMNKHSADMLKAIKDIKGDIQSLTERTGETEARISQAEDDVISLQGRVKSLEKTVEVLSDRVAEQEDRSRRSNLRLVGLPEKSEGSDLCGFLEKWFRETLGEDFTSSRCVERAHRIGPLTSNPAAPRVVLMKFLSYRDREAALKAVRKMKEVHYKNHRVTFFPDLSAETRKLQRRFDGVKIRLRALKVRYGILYPAHLIITHNDKRRIFKSVEEAEKYIDGISSQAEVNSKT